MANNNKLFVWILVVALIIFILLGKQLGVFSSTGGAVIRTVSDVTDGKAIVTYTASGTGAYGVSILDTISGDCYFPDGTKEYLDVILSDGSLTRSVEVTVNGTCTLIGDYKFGTNDIVDLEDDTLSLDGTTSSTGTSGLPFSDGIENLLNISSDTPKNTATFYVILFYLAIVGIIIFLIKLYQNAPKSR